MTSHNSEIDVAATDSTRADTAFTGSIPEIYDRFMVPMLFQPYARDLARRILGLAPGAILETAAGSGVLPRVLAPQLSPETDYIITDLNQEMLDHARSRQPGLDWRQADALALPFDDGRFDCLACQFGVMFFPDRAQGFAEARRVLRPGGTYLFNVWDRISENALADMVTDAAAAILPDDPPRFLARTPHGYHDPVLIAQELRYAGFRDVGISYVDGMSRVEDPTHPAIAFCRGTPLYGEILDRDPDTLAEIIARASDRIAARYGPGPVSAPMRALIITAIA